jgi:iron complex transport system ATP-binding protein
MNSPTSPVLKLKDVTVKRGTLEILRGIDWTIRPGEHWAVLGLNGAGKSTLLDVLLAYLPATSGTIDLLGERYGSYDWRELRERIGVVSQNFGFRFPGSETVMRIVPSGATGTVGLRRDPTDDERDAAIPYIELLGLEHRTEQPWRLLSQGERQRTLIARALFGRPPILILDEPCAGLDPIARQLLIDRIDQIIAREDAPTIILVTHHVEEIGSGLTHVLGLADGEVVVADKRQSVLTADSLQRIYGRPLDIWRDDTGTLRLNLKSVPTSD